MLGLLGMVSDIVANYNYDKQGNMLSAGAPVKRNYGLNGTSFTHRIRGASKPNLTVTYGLRWSLFPRPGRSTVSRRLRTSIWGTQFDQTVKNMKQGIGYDATPLVSFVLGGPANHGPGWYNFEKSDFSPRISVAYSPRPQSGWLRKHLRRR